jgi:hypothetical protein
VFYTSTGPALIGNWFERNSGAGGGGLNLQVGAAPPVDANTFVSNTAGIGGGIYLFQAGAVTLTNNLVIRNTAAGAGGGVVIVESPARLINNTVADNTSDGVWFAGAEGAAIVNNIIAGNSGDGLERDTIQSTASYTADYNDLVGNANAYQNLPPGAHDRTANPQFVATGSDLPAYYHLQNTSPVSTTGSPAWAPARDIDGDVRSLGSGVSMGADEIAWPAQHVYLPVVLK